jgi:ParB family transcriptional regulator, chromosome partitioning protein
MTAIHTIPFEDIEVGARMRQLREPIVAELMESIRAVGLLHPISVTRSGKTFHLVAGAHRLEAIKRLKIYARIEAIVLDKDADQAALAEIDENLTRAELSPAERAMHVDARKTIYERLHPETKPTKAGGPGRGKRTRSQNETDTPADAFIDDTAKKTGKSRATTAREAKRGKEGRDWLREITGTSLDEKSEIDALIKLPDEERNQLIARAKAGEKVSAKSIYADLPWKVEPEPALSMSATQKLDAYKRRLDREYAWRMKEEAQALAQEQIRKWLDYWKEQEAEYDAVIKARRGVMDRAFFRRILARLHPDAGGQADLFDAFKKMEKLLLNEAECPTKARTLPTQEELVEAMRKTRAEPA